MKGASSKSVDGGRLDTPREPYVGRALDISWVWGGLASRRIGHGRETRDTICVGCEALLGYLEDFTDFKQCSKAADEVEKAVACED